MTLLDEVTGADGMLVDEVSTGTTLGPAEVETGSWV
jgi:hypothetical protein